MGQQEEERGEQRLGDTEGSQGLPVEKRMVRSLLSIGSVVFSPTCCFLGNLPN
jgi:hypothetical protein